MTTPYYDVNTTAETISLSFDEGDTIILSIWRNNSYGGLSASLTWKAN